MPVVRIPTDRITDWDSFHNVFAAALDFPEYYGRNMDAWIDCLTYADDADTLMIAPESAARAGDVLTLQLDDVASFAEPGDIPEHWPRRESSGADCG